MQNSSYSPDKAAEYHLNQYQPNTARFSLYEIEDYLKKYDKKRRKAHAGINYQIIWFKKGSGRYFVNSKVYDIDQNTLFLLSKKDLHYFDRNTHYSGVLMQFNEEFLIQNSSDLDFISRHALFNNKQQRVCPLDSNDAFILDEYLRMLKDELSHKNESIQQEFLRWWLKVFLIQVQRRSEKSIAIDMHRMLPEDKKQLKLIKFVNLIEQNYKKGLKVSDYAALLQISHRTLSALTSRLLDKSPSEMIQERITSEAKRMLMENNYTISRIGHHLGFQDDSYFVKYFKKQTDISPLDFRKQSGSR